ncbi:MAG: hypothetical protein AAFO03_10430 [Bacteroidota bacterium]
MTRASLTTVVFLLLALAVELQAQIACPFGIPKKDEIFSTWEKAPLLLVRSEYEAPDLDLVSQSNRAFLQFIYLNFQYPKLDPHELWSDLIVVTFVIDAEGKVDPEQVRCIRTPHSELGWEAERVIRLMAALDMRWQPGTVAGEPVPVRFNVPIRLRLD